MQQMVNFVPFLTTQATQAPASGSGQAAVPGLFQALLLEALTGAQPAAEQALPGATLPSALLPATPVPGAPVPGAPVPTAPVSGVPASAVPAQAAPLAQVQTTPAQAAQPQAPSAESPTLPLRLSGPTPPVMPVETEQEPAAPEETEEPQPTPAADSATQATQTPSPALQAQVAQLVQTQAAPQAQPQAQPGEPGRPQSQTQAVASGDEPANPQMESFVQKAVRAVQQGESAPETAEREPGAQPTFQDLVELVAAADKAGTARPAGTVEAPAVPAPRVEEPAQTEPPAAVTGSHEPKALLQESPGTEAAQPAPRQPVEPEQVLRQVTRFVKVMVDTKQSEVRLNLHPEHLGHVAVKLVIGDGILRANLVAQDMAVKAALEANLDQLKTRLSDQGFQVEQVHVTVGGDSQPQHSRHGEQQRQAQQPWRSQNWGGSRQEETGPSAQQTRQTPANAWVRGTGMRLNSLA